MPTRKVRGEYRWGSRTWQTGIVVAHSDQQDTKKNLNAPAHRADDDRVSVDSDRTLCPSCCRINTVMMWWHDEKNHRWICYPCGMGRREEQDRIERKWKRDNPR